jgi:hypothetical protein
MSGLASGECGLADSWHHIQPDLLSDSVPVAKACNSENGSGIHPGGQHLHLGENTKQEMKLQRRQWCHETMAEVVFMVV